jgi:hypothetical protein
MSPLDALSDTPVTRLNDLAAQLQERMGEAEEIRIRFTKARDANVWPDMRLATQLLEDANSRAH